MPCPNSDQLEPQPQLVEEDRVGVVQIVANLKLKVEPIPYLGQNPSGSQGTSSFNTGAEEASSFYQEAGPTSSSMNNHAQEPPNTTYSWYPLGGGCATPFPVPSMSHGGGIPPPPPTGGATVSPQDHMLPQPTTHDTTERLRSAAEMIQTDILSQHQTRRGASRMPSQSRLRSFRDTTPYSASTSSYTGTYAPHSAHSHPTSSQASQSTYSDINDKTDNPGLPRVRRRARHGIHGRGSRATKDLGDNVQDILSYTHLALVNDMVLNMGWCNGDAGQKKRIAATRECFSQAVAALDKGDLNINCTKHMASAIERDLSAVQGRLADIAKTYAQRLLQSNDPQHKESPEAYAQWMQDHVAKLHDQKDVANFFLHEHDNTGAVVRWFGNQVLEDLFIDFWYGSNFSPIHKFQSVWTTAPLHGYSIMAAALACTLHRVSTGRIHGTGIGNVIPFKGQVYANYSDGYYQSMINALHNRMDWFAAQTSCPETDQTVYLPPADEVAKVHNSFLCSPSKQTGSELQICRDSALPALSCILAEVCSTRKDRHPQG
ncbi:hypothetical protein BS17DRAFT_882416 [Gyrodon lividus]|nr:hypothetical protein BS17DRAFT_882416 [Gyrodon lividus]